RPVWEMVYNHYHNRIGLDVPLLGEAAAKTRPEVTSFDHPGAGTLLFTLERRSNPNHSPIGAPKTPGPVIAKGYSDHVSLRWPKALDADCYSIMRATGVDTPLNTLVSGLKDSEFVDLTVEAGKLYRYVVQASNIVGASPNTPETRTVAGLPVFW